jgi:starch-binding outer membrane protein, SusD/RagB family
MRIRNLLLSGAFLVAVSGCDSALDIDPTTVVPEEDAFKDVQSARAAVNGMYDALQGDQDAAEYYAAELQAFSELSSDNAQHTGTFSTYREADRALLTSANGSVDGIWGDIYDAINRANMVIAHVPGVPGLDPAERDEMLGEAHFVRALTHHDASKMWGGVPIKTAPVAGVSEASNVSRATLAEVYTQVLADLVAAEGLLSNTSDPTRASLGAVRALRARVLLYRASAGPTGLNDGNWAAVEAAATAAMAGYTLAAEYADLFDADGGSTSEDIFRLRFSAQDPNYLGYYFMVKTLGGRYEVGPTTNLRQHYAAEPTDQRFAHNIAVDPASATRFYMAKFPTPVGAEHPHVIRLAEVILIRAEARARQNNFLGAVQDYNLIRVRAGLAPHTFGVQVTDQATVLAAILRERRSELAFEGDRWFDIVRRGDIPTMQAHLIANGRTFAPYQILYPIPQGEIDVTRDDAGVSRLTQNPGY